MSTLTRYRPVWPQHSLRRDLDRFFGDLFPTFGEEDREEAFSAVWAPQMDLSETDKAYLVKMDLPGIDKDQVTVNVQGSQLTVRGERKEEKQEEQENYLRMERSYGSFYRSIPLPKSAAVDEVKAEFKNGVLRVSIPKAAESRPHKVTIS